MTPGKKLTIEAVQQEFAAAGCLLQSPEYAGNKQKLQFQCACGNEGEKTLAHFRRGPHCKACGYKATGTKNGRLSLEDAQAVFSASGCTLLATKYTDNAAKMQYLCKCGSLHEMSLGNFRKGKRCPTCAGVTQWTLETAQAVYLSHGCELLVDQYSGVNTNMLYRCSCGRESATTFGNFLRGVRCKSCATERITGPNNYLYDPTLTLEQREKKRLYPEYQQWRRTVLQRDDFTCLLCGLRGGEMHAHHLDSYAKHPELRTVPDNGVTLCRKCHDQFHLAHGVCRPTTRDQFNVYQEAINA